MTDYRAASQRSFDRQADSYDTGSYSHHARELYPVMLAQAAGIPHKSVLDLGCGTGELLSQVLGRWPETACAGLDLSERMLEVARRKLKGRAELVQGDAAALPFGDGRFDLVLCTDSFHHYPQPERVVEEVFRVLQPGGVFLLADTTAPAGLRGLTNLLLPYGSGGDVRLYGPGEMRALLEGGGLHGVECRKRDATSLLAWGIK